MEDEKEEKDEHPLTDSLSAREQIAKQRVEDFEKETGTKVTREVDDEPDPEPEGTPTAYQEQADAAPVA
jgi:hypothetical protein